MNSLFKLLFASSLICLLGLSISSCNKTPSPPNKWDSNFNTDTMPGMSSIITGQIPFSNDTMPGHKGLPTFPVLQISFNSGFFTPSDTLTYTTFTPGKDTLMPAQSGAILIYDNNPADPSATLTTLGQTYVFTDPAAIYTIVPLAMTQAGFQPMNSITYTPGSTGTYDGFYGNNKIEFTIN